MAAPVHNDPLSSIAFAEPQDDLVEEVPIHDDLPAHKGEEAAGDHALGADAHQLNSSDGQSQDTGGLLRQHDTTRVDHMASYGQLVGQPSYSDDSALFDRQAGAGESSRAASSSSSSSTPALKITVTDPLKKVEQNFMGVQGGYVTYRVNTQTSMPSYPRSGSAVRRRFRDFVALGDLLKTTHRGYFIPPRPEKNPLEGQRASTDFVEGRRTALQHYLEQLAAHPVISQSEELRAFLTVEGSLADSYQWRQLQPLQGSVLEGIARLPKQLLGQEGAITAPAEAAQSTKQTGDLLRRFKEYATSVKEGMRAEPPALTDEETALRNEKIRVDDFQDKMIHASRKAEKMVSSFEEMGDVLGDLGLALIAMAKYEDEEGAKTGSYTDSSAAARDISADARRIGMTSVRLSRLSRQATAGFVTELTPLHDHLALTRAVAKALREREQALLTVQALENELGTKRRGISSLEESGQQVFGGDKGKTRRVHTLQTDVAALQAALEAAKAEYDRVLDRNLKEVQRWEKERAEDFSTMLNQFAGMEVAFHERSRDTWQEAAEQLPEPPAAPRP